jgi:uncharacterized damage-inducible protein DinB
MKRTTFLIGSLIAAPVFAQAPTSAAASASTPAPAATANAGVVATKNVFNSMSRFFTAAAEQVSEADYAYRPVATVRSFGELIGHVAGANYMMCAAALGEAPRGEDDIEKSAKTKAALVAALKGSNEYCAKAYAMSDADAAGMTKLFGQDQTKMFALSLTAAHVGEHYGNVVTYMRMKGMVPPSSQPRQ